MAVIVRRQDLRLEVKDIHPAEVEKRTDRRISAIRMVAAGVPEFQPVSKSLFDSNVDVVSGDGAGVDSVELAMSHLSQAPFLGYCFPEGYFDLGIIATPPTKVLMTRLT